MGLFSKFKDYQTNKRLERMKSDFMLLQKRQMIYNPMTEFFIHDYLKAETFSRRISEYLIWYTATPRLLRLFYQNALLQDESFNYFWATAPANYRMVHSGIPSLISSKMAVILFGGGYTLDVEMFKEDGTIDANASKLVQETLEVLRNKTRLDNFLLPKAATTESVFGHLFLKLNYDLSISQYPIPEIADIRNAEVIKTRGITTEIIFKTWYKKEAQNYVLYERYITLKASDEHNYEEGTSAIKYELYMVKAGNELVLVDLDKIPETSELEELIIFDGMKGLLAFEKPNKLPNNEFIDSYYGASDYQGAISSYDSLDEILSEIIREARTNKTLRYVPSSMLQYNTNGELAALNSFIDNYVLMNDASIPAERKDGKVQITEINDKTAQHVEKWKIALTTAINKAGLSPLALGITGLEAVNAGENSQRERNKATLETRALKIKMWSPFLEEMFMQLLAFNSWMQKNGAVQPDVNTVDVDYTNCNVSVHFGDYISDTQAEKLTSWGTAKQMGVASIETAINMIHPDWTETQKLEEVQRIKYQNAIAMDTPETLQMEDLLNPKDEDSNPNKPNIEEKEKPEDINNGNNT